MVREQLHVTVDFSLSTVGDLCACLIEHHSWIPTLTLLKMILCIPRSFRRRSSFSFDVDFLGDHSFHLPSFDSKFKTDIADLEKTYIILRRKTQK